MAIAATIAKPAESSILQGKKTLEPILRTENLWKLYRAGKVEVPALRGVNFEVLPGESVAVMGPSGCGKSSLLYLIGGLAQATRGKVLVDGNDLTALSDAARTKLRRHKIGFVFQRFNLLPTDRKSTRLNSSHGYISYAVFCLKKKKVNIRRI